MAYYSRLWRWPFTINPHTFGMDSWLPLPLPKGWKISFGFWVRYTVDGPGLPPSIVHGKETHSSFFRSSVVTMEEYEYTPLARPERQIRLLRIHPGAPGDPIEATLSTFNLEDAPKYEALSYVLGGGKDFNDITVNGQLLRILRNLFDALQAIRYADSERLIRIDAICMNQRDNNERSSQVKIMADIYGGADNVAVYLGQATNQTEEGIQNLRDLMDVQTSKEDPPWSNIRLPDLESGLADIIARPWFTRIWTVQEVTLARQTTLICGNHQIHWRVDLRTMKAIIFRIKAAIISPYYGLGYGDRSTLDWSPFLDILETQMRQAARREGVVLRRNQLDLAYDFRHRESTDSRDKYYAIFGIIENDQSGRLSFDPDYSLNLEDVHRQFEREIQRIDGIEDVPVTGS